VWDSVLLLYIIARAACDKVIEARAQQAEF